MAERRSDTRRWWHVCVTDHRADASADVTHANHVGSFLVPHTNCVCEKMGKIPFVKWHRFIAAGETQPLRMGGGRVRGMLRKNQLKSIERGVEKARNETRRRISISFSRFPFHLDGFKRLFFFFRHSSPICGFAHSRMHHVLSDSLWGPGLSPDLHEALTHATR